MIHFDVKLLEYEQFQRALDSLRDTRLHSQAQRAGIREIAKEGKQKLKAAVSKRLGILQAGIGYKTLSKRRKAQIGAAGDDIVMEVGATRKVLDRRLKVAKKRYQTYKLRMLNEGVKAHVIKAKNRKSLWIQGRNAIGSSVMHPGFAGRDYSRRVDRALQPKVQGLFVKGAANVLRKHGVRASM